MDAPPAPSAQEWALAATYTLKNSKRYRHNWGQQVRSLMGTAHEGPDQGAVRFRIEIAPSGSLARLDTLWATSDAVEQRARNAVQQMPPLPPTPNGKPLVFEKTITFDAWTADVPPLYKNDCDPDPVQHGNRFVWDGRSPPGLAAEEPEPQKPDPEALADCLRQLPQDSIEAEAADDQRQQEQWGSQKLGR
jgi:TonB family protein